MVDVNDYKEEKSCVYNGEEYLVRDNGAILRKTPPGKKHARKLDNVWTFGTPDAKTGYLMFTGNVRVHRVVAVAFHGEAPAEGYVVDHIDTNRQNNRPSNLRWLTRLENVVLNETTRKRIEYRTGVSVYEFLANPSKYRECFVDPDFSWMRRVTDEEARACLENVKRFGEKKNPSRSTGGKMGEWVYHLRDFDRNYTPSLAEEKNIIDSLTPLAKQKDWRTKTKFVCCPNEINGEPMKCYWNNLREDATFNENQFGSSTIVRFAMTEKSEILVVCAIPSPIKPFGLVKVTFEDGYYIHESLGMYFTLIGAEKQFTLAQGLEWTGEDSIDDYC